MPQFCSSEGNQHPQRVHMGMTERKWRESGETAEFILQPQWRHNEMLRKVFFCHALMYLDNDAQAADAGGSSPALRYTLDARKPF